MLAHMRTTIVVDEDISIEIERIAEKDNRTKKEVINDLLRKGLSKEIEKKRDSSTTTEPYRLGKCFYPNIDNISEVLAAAETEDYK